MADLRFHQRSSAKTLNELAKISGATFDTAHANKTIIDVANLQDAASDTISFLDNQKYKDALSATNAGAVFVHPNSVDLVPKHTVAMITKQPHRAYALAANAFYPTYIQTSDIHPTAVIHPTAKIGNNCRIEPYVVIGENVEIGDGSWVGANSVISHSVIGKKFRCLPGAKIGQDGFGFALGMDGHIPVPQLGRVIIGNNVTIGANTCVDRGAGPDTIIGDGTVIDNLVQIAHNVQIGKLCVIVAQAGISGSTVLGNLVVCGGQSGIAGHLKIGDGARIAAQSGVTKDLVGGKDYVGFPAEPAKQYWRMVAGLRGLLSKGSGKANQG